LNAQLEEKLASLSQLSESGQKLKKQNDALLILLGEKEEELQATLMDSKETKQLYQAHIKELLDRLTPES
jgi:hypothetical protein